jgi:hypothetical protein
MVPALSLDVVVILALHLLCDCLYLLSGEDGSM